MKNFKLIVSYDLWLDFGSTLNRSKCLLHYCQFVALKMHFLRVVRPNPFHFWNYRWKESFYVGSNLLRQLFHKMKWFGSELPLNLNLLSIWIFCGASELNPFFEDTAHCWWIRVYARWKSRNLTYKLGTI